MDWNDPRRGLPEAPQEGQEYEEGFREVRQIVRAVSQGMSFGSTKASITLDPDFNVKELTIEGFVA